jgi:tetratricopeptide (TPR) repeat protein
LRSCTLTDTLPTMQLGERVGGRFSIRRRAGSGGMSEVFEALDEDAGVPVAVKILRGASAEDLPRLEREARALAALRHPAVVRYVAHGSTDAGKPYLVMEWLDGEDLSSLLQRRQLDADEALSLARRVAGALAEAHRCGAIHRDIKPSNLFLVRGAVDQVKLIDFGIARLGALTRMTRTGVLLGTPGYMAPEQVCGELHLTPAVDVFALGAVLFEALAGRPTFQADSVMALFAKLVFEDPPPLAQLRPDVPLAMAALVGRMLAKNPSVRPRDGAALLAELEAIEQRRSLDDGPAPAAGSPGSLGTAERRVVSVVLIGAARPDPVDPAGTTVVVHRDAAASLQELGRITAEAGGRLELLADGTAAIALGETGVAKDRAARAARLALALRSAAANRPIAVATSGDAIAGRGPVGDAIDRAARRLAQPGSDAGSAPVAIAIDEVTRALLDPRFDVRDSDAGPELWAEREHARAPRPLLGKPTPCVGRERELKVLGDAFAECTAERRTQAFVVIAPAGTGKSRLAQELLRSLRWRGEPLEVWVGRGDSLRAGSPLGLLGQALRGAAGIVGGEPLTERRGKLRTWVERLVGPTERRRVTDFLGEVVGAPMPDDDSAPLRAARQDPLLMAEQMQRAFEDIVSAAGARSPVVLVLEDLHWGDAATVRFVDAALRVAEQSPLFVLALARPEILDLAPALWAERGAQVMNLRPLPRKAAERLAREMLGEAASDTIVARIVDQAEGHAFYLEELIRAAAEGKRALPETVVAMVQSRIEGLELEARRVLRAASVFGEVFWQGGLATLLGGPAEGGAASGWLAHLVDQGVIVRRRESRFPGEEELAFRHALLREGAYAMLTEADRALGHRLAGAWLSARGEADALLLAEHFERGGELEHAAGQCIVAAEQASRSGDDDATRSLAERGLAFGVGEPARSALLGLICQAHAWRAEFQAALPHAEEVVRAAPAGSVPWVRGIMIKLRALMTRGETEEFVALAEFVLSVEPAPEMTKLLTWVLGAFCIVVDIAGRFDVAVRIGERMDALAARFGEHHLDVPAWVSASRAQRLGLVAEHPWAALEQTGVAEDLCRRTNDRRFLLLLQSLRGMNLWFLGALDEAERKLRPVADMHPEFGIISAYPLFCLSGVLAERGALDEACSAAARLVDSARARGIALDEGRGRWALGSALLGAGRLEEAEREATAAREILAAVPLDLPGLLATLAAVRLARGRVDDALAAAREGLARYETQGAAGFFRGARIRLVHAECLHAAGRIDEARDAVGIARDRLLGLAERIGDPARRRSFLEDVPENARTLSLARAWLAESRPGHSEG